MFSSTEFLTDQEVVLGVKNGKQNASGMGVWRTAFILATQIAGTGILALPMAASLTGGWLGVVLMAVLCANAGYVDMHLGLCWVMLEKHYPELKGAVRDPYPTIGEKALGPWARRIIAVSMQVTLFGAGTAFLLLASETLERQLHDVLPEMSSCLWLLVFAIVVCPFTWLGSPKNFWGLGLLGIVLIMVATCIAVVKSILDLQAATVPPDTSLRVTTDNFFLGFGMTLFAFGGGAIFPTVQNDMNKRKRFPVAVLIAFIAILLVYVPVASTGFAAYGHGVQRNIFASLSRGPAVTAAEYILVCNLLIVFVLATNPAMSILENTLNIEDRFGWRRCVARSACCLLMLSLAASVREFSKVLALVGGSTIVFLNLVCPSVLYLTLKIKLEPHTPVPLWKRIYMCVVIVLGFVGGIAATSSAVAAIFGSSNFTKPCYWPDSSCDT